MFNDKQTGLISRIDLKNPRIIALYWLMFGLMLIISAVCLFPPIWVILSSFKDMREFFAVPPTIIPKTFHFDKIVQTWNSLNFTMYYLNTFYMAAGDLVFCIVINGLCGYVLSRLKPKGGQILLALILWTMMMPGGLNIVPLFKTFLHFPIIGVNLSNTYIPMWLMSGSNTFFILIFKSFFDSIPMSYIESANIDGCSKLGTFIKIIIPLSKPVLMVICIFSISSSWENFLWPYLILKNPNLYTITIKILSMKDTFSADICMVALLFAMLPPAILFIFFQKHIMSGFTLSGVKG